ncbi:MAG: type II secretion system minor pseudopilin GspK [Planctomycetaceae bacterium]|nr:type II secretion system minor pseudopilin GspK [Planctomycetaceae bacterium]
MRTRDRGVALILALLVLVILVVVILQMTASSLHNRTVADNHLADLQNAYGARAGYTRALLYLQADLDQKPEVDSLQERWAAPIDFDLGRAQVRVTIVDAERLLNLSQLVNDKGEQNPVVCAQLRRLVKVLRHTPDMADRIIDYIDGDNKGEFESKAKNDRLYNLEELLRVDGLPAEVIYGGIVSGEERKGLREFLTIWPRTTPEGNGTTAGMVNINTASSEVLQSLSDQMAPGLADAIVAYRTQPGPDGKPQQFEKADDLKRVQGMSDGLFNDLAGKVTVKSSTFEIRCRGTVGKVEKTWVYVVQRKGGTAPGAATTTGTPPAPTPPPPSGTAAPATGAPAAGATLTLIGSQMLNDFASIKPPDVQR